MSAVARPCFVRAGERRLFCVEHPARGQPEAALLLCPPMLNEYPTSLRLFALLGEALAQRGIHVLRFDYHGTGDSSGDGTAFSLAGARSDTESMLAYLRSRAPDAPALLMGVRAGVLPASAIAARHGLPLVAWDPVVDGAQWARELRRLDARARACHLTFPLIGRRREMPQLGEAMMGFRLAARWIGELEATRAQPCRDALVLARDGAVPALGARQDSLALPAVLASWPGKIGIEGVFPPGVVDELAQALAERLPRASTRRPVLQAVAT